MIARGVYVRLSALSWIDWFRLGLLLGAACWGLLAVLVGVAAFSAPQSVTLNGQMVAHPVVAAISATIIMAVIGAVVTLVSSAVAALILRIVGARLSLGGLGVPIEAVDDPTGDVIRR